MTHLSNIEQSGRPVLESARSHKSKPDRRTQRTRQALMSAFLELVFTRGYEALSAREIARRANVGRSTFYLHYAGKDALLEESLHTPSRALAACVGGKLTPEQLTRLLDHFREQRALNRIFFADPIRSLWVRCVASLIEPSLARQQPRGMRPRAPRSLVAVMIAEMQVGLIAHWVTRQVSVKSNVIAAALIASTQAMLSAVEPL
ncbi:MAG TPA: helix-turn-helix domain-containing protein [Steroidobacteraceae bacterium]|nr:helix-turn-helix domain-containing protein [Steroidobacteraceae bacterium]